MGEVYSARDTRLNRTVAVKILPAALAADPQFRERLRSRRPRNLPAHHPHICTLFAEIETIAIEFITFAVETTAPGSEARWVQLDLVAKHLACSDIRIEFGTADRFLDIGFLNRTPRAH